MSEDEDDGNPGFYDFIKCAVRCAFKSGNDDEDIDEGDKNDKFLDCIDDCLD